MKKQSDLSRLMEYAAGHKVLTWLSWVLSAMSALLSLGIYGVSSTIYWKFPRTFHRRGMSYIMAGLPYCLQLYLLLFI